MARSHLQKAMIIDESVLRAAARARRRALLLLHGAIRAAGFDQVKLANALGLKKAAVNAVLNGNGNLSLNTLAEYMGAMGFEVDLVATSIGEIEVAQAEHRPPRYVQLSASDQARLGKPVEALGSSARAIGQNADLDWLSVFASGVTQREVNASVFAVFSKDSDSEPVATERKVKVWSSKL